MIYGPSVRCLPFLVLNILPQNHAVLNTKHQSQSLRTQPHTVLPKPFSLNSTYLSWLRTNVLDVRVLAIGTLHSTIYVLRTLIDYVVLYDPSMRVQYALGFRKFRVYAVLVLIGSVGIGVLVDDAAQGFRVQRTRV